MYPLPIAVFVIYFSSLMLIVNISVNAELCNFFLKFQENYHLLRWLAAQPSVHEINLKDNVICRRMYLDI